LIFDPPFTTGEEAADSIGAGDNGGFSGPKAVAMVGEALFVADYDNNRVLRFTGPFNTPDQVYTATAEFGSLTNPVDLTVDPDGSLLVTDQGNKRVARFNDAVIRASTNTVDSSFNDFMHDEPLGVAADRTGRVYVADYQAYRVLIRQERVQTTPISPGSTAAAQNLLANLHQRVNRVRNRVAIGQQMRTWDYGAKTSPKRWYGDWLHLKQQGLPLPEIMGGEMSDLWTKPGFTPNRPALQEMLRHGKSGHPRISTSARRRRRRSCSRWSRTAPRSATRGRRN
jgi:hypothetical protein